MKCNKNLENRATDKLQQSKDGDSDLKENFQKL